VARIEEGTTNIEKDLHDNPPVYSAAHDKQVIRCLPLDVLFTLMIFSKDNDAAATASGFLLEDYK
jgi:hypothetical protein